MRCGRIVLLGFATGCVANIVNAPAPKVTTERVVQKNYQLGQAASAFIGNPVIRVKDYLLMRKEVPVMVADQDVTLHVSSSCRS